MRVFLAFGIRGFRVRGFRVRARDSNCHRVAKVRIKVIHVLEAIGS